MVTIASGTAGRVVRLDEMPPAAQCASACCIVLSRIDMMLGANGRRDDVGFVYVAARERLNDSPPREHDDLVAQPLELRRIGGIDDDRRAGIGDLA